MFQIISNAKSRDIIGQISLPEFVNIMKSPDFTRKSQVDYARTLDRKDDRYKAIKVSLPCIAFNYTHNSIINGSTRVNPTGYFYIDIDNVNGLDFSTVPFVAASWKSLSGGGYGVLCRVDGVTLDNYKKVAKELAKVLNVDYDNGAVSSDRICVIGYDPTIYYNHTPTVYNYIDTIEVKGDIQINNKNIYNKVGLNVTFSSNNTIKTSNLEELIRDVDFNGELFIDLKENKLEYAQVIVPKIIPDGKRNAVMFPIVSQIYGLNPWMSYNGLFNFSNSINKDKFHPPLDFNEMDDLVSKVINKEAQIYLNMKRRFLFNPDYNLSGAEKKTIAVINTNKSKGEATYKRILDLLNEWDYINWGKITQVKIASRINKTSRTVKRHFDKIKEEVKILNLEHKYLDIK